MNAALADPKGQRTTWTYDIAGRPTRTTYADGSCESYTYDAAGRRMTYTTRATVTAGYTYDNRDRLVATDWSDATPDTTRAYDAAGRLLTLATAGVATHTYAYDAAGELLGETTAPAALAPASFAVGYAYDLDGRRSRLIYPDGSVVSYAYTARDQVKAIEAGGPPPLASYTYDANGNRLTKTLENGTRATYAYDAANRLTQIAHKKGAANLFTVGYDLNAAGNRESKLSTVGSQPSASETYTYDAVDQVTGAASTSATQTFAYDAVGNRQSTAHSVSGATHYTSNTLNQYTSVGGDILLYDGNGNLVTQGLAANYSYDAQNRLLGATKGTSTMSVTYDGRNRPVSRTLNGTTTYFVYDGWRLIAEYSSAGTLLTRYVHGPVMDEILAKTDANGTVYYHHDGLGSTVALSNAEGNVVESYSYDVFGSVSIFDAAFTPLPSSLQNNRFLFTGREWLAEVGLYDYRNRIYSHELGRFLQTDPIRFAAGDVNLYRYCGNRGSMLSDPFGLCPDDEEKDEENYKPTPSDPVPSTPEPSDPSGGGGEVSVIEKSGQALLAHMRDHLSVDLNVNTPTLYGGNVGGNATGVYGGGGLGRGGLAEATLTVNYSFGQTPRGACLGLAAAVGWGPAGRIAAGVSSGGGPYLSVGLGFGYAAYVGGAAGGSGYIYQWKNQQ